MDSLKHEEEQRSRAPALTIEEYTRQLADRGEAVKLQQLHSVVYSQISGMVLKQNLEDLNNMASQGNGQMPQMPGFPMMPPMQMPQMPQG